jgi:short-subunit dehydrogenase
MTDSSKKLHILITGATSGIGKQLTKDYLLKTITCMPLVVTMRRWLN